MWPLRHRKTKLPNMVMCRKEYFTMKKVILSIISAFLSLFFLCSPVAAASITPDYAEDQVIAAATAGSQTTSGEYTVSPGDPIQYSVSLELPDTAEFIRIQPHSSMNFVSGGTLYVMNDKGQVIYTQNLGYTSTDGYFYDLSDMPDGGGTGFFTYVVSAGDVLSTGLVGMSGQVIVSDTDGNILTTSEAPAVYSLSAVIQTVDTKRTEEKTSTRDQGIVTYNGQHVEGASFILYRDKELKNPVSFKESFRTYTVCPDGTDGATQVMEADISGTLTVKGLRAGTYYLTEEKAPVDYYNATTAPIVLSLDIERDSSGKLKMVMNTTEPKDEDDEEEAVPNDQVIQLSNKGSGASIVVDYKNVNKKPRAPGVIAVCCGGFAIGCGCYAAGKSHNRPKNPNTHTEE